MDPIVATTAGAVRGTLDSGVLTWRAVPYGASTAGMRRWRAPHPPEKWEGIVDCTRFGMVATQPFSSFTADGPNGEDCLNLDIVRPADTDEILPVVVYLHGGGYVLGSSHQDMLRGHLFAKAARIVYVSLNFRLGALGYLDVSSLEGDAEPNPAVMDQLLALEWVRDNIAHFGGDPNQVTLMGESAGGAAVLTMMCLKPARGLFHRAIAQSAPASAFHTHEQAALWTRRLVSRLGLDPATTTVQKLRKIPAQTIVDAGQSMMWRSQGLKRLNMCYAPRVDGHLITEHPLTVFAKGQQNPVPLIIGTNNDEVSIAKLLYVRRKARSRGAGRILTHYDPVGAHQILSVYNGCKDRADYARMLTDAIFWAPSVRSAQAHAAIADTWMYRFDFTPVVMQWLGLGAMHSMELSAIFGDHDVSRLAAVSRIGGTGNLDDVTQEMQKLWTSFIRSGKPGAGWPRYRPGDDINPGRATRIFDDDYQVVYDPFPQLRRAWESFDFSTWTALGDSADLE